MLTIKEIKLKDNVDWDELIKESFTATFFQTKEWLELWIKYWGKTGKAVIYAVFDNEELIGVAPLYQTVDTINILGAPDPSTDGSFSDFGDIIIESGREKEVWENLARQCLVDSQGIALNFIREDSPSFEILKNLGGKAEEIEVAPYINLPKTWEEYLLTLDRHDRHEIRRKMRKAADAGVIKVCDDINTENINDFFRLMTVSDENKKKFLSIEIKKFLSEMILKLGAKKLLNLCFLRYNNENIASILLLQQKNEVLLYNSGFDLKYSYLSPGLILNVLAIKQAIEEGKDRFDFLRGGEKYKYDLGGVKRNLYKISFR